MPIYCLETPVNKFFERQLPNGKYRYEGYFHTVKYCIDSAIRKTKYQIDDFLESCSIDFLVNNESYIITLWKYNI
jgi:hypothetical protein